MLAPQSVSRNATPWASTRRPPPPAASIGRGALLFVICLVAATTPAYAQGALTNGGNHSGSISAPLEGDTWTFSANQNDTVIINIGEVAQVVDPGFWPWLRVRNPNGVQIATNYGDRAAQLALTAPLTGTYTVIVASADTGNDATGDYLLTMARIPGTPVIPADDEGGLMTQGENHRGHLHLGDLDQWTFTATQSDAILLSIGEILETEPDPGLWPWIRLYGPNGALLATNYGNWVAYVSAAAPLTGTYTVVVGTADTANDAIGDYQLTLAKIPGTFVVPDGDHGGPMTNGANHQGLLHQGDLDQWTFTASQNDAIALSIGEIEVPETEPDPGFWPWIRLYGPNGALLSTNYGDLVAYIAATAPLTGTYTVVVGTADTANDAIGEYQLTLARIPGTFVVPAGDDGGAMTAGANHQGRIHLGDQDQWTFTASQNDAITLSIGEIEVPGTEPDPGFWPYIRLYGPNGTLLAYNYGNLVAYISATAPLSGTYTVVVGTADTANDAVGDYRLTYTRIPGTFTVPSGDQGGAMSSGVQYPAQIHLGDLDYWTFYAAQNATITVNISEVISSPDPGFWGWIRIYGPTGTLLRSTWGDIGATATFVVPLTGLHTIVVGTADTANDAVGSYQLQVLGNIPVPAPTAPERIAIGLGPKAGDGGWFATRKDRANGFGAAPWSRLPWPAYNASGGGLRLAAGDVDGDGLDEIVAGLTSGGNGWFVVLDDAAHNYAPLRWIQVQWPTYNAANGEVWPAVGNIDGDPRAEIVIGLGAGGYGWYEVFDDAVANYAHLSWQQVAWPAYATRSTAVVRPAIGNVDGSGSGEIILGLGAGSNGWLVIVNGASGNYSHRTWLQVAWPGYNTSNGATFPAAGDIDGDGRAEIVVGLGSGGGGWMQVFQDAAGGHAHVTWLRTSWAAYNNSPGETHPAIGNVDDDAAAEIVVGLGPIASQGGWFEILDNQSAGFASLGWRNLDWAPYTATGGATYPTVGRFR
jgi:hypothetical protein